MPITKSAKKSLRVGQRQAKENLNQRKALKKALKEVDQKNINKVISLIDKAAKTGLIHQNKAARLKSRLTKKFGTPKETKKAEPKAAPKTAKESKPAAKKKVKKSK